MRMATLGISEATPTPNPAPRGEELFSARLGFSPSLWVTERLQQKRVAALIPHNFPILGHGCCDLFHSDQVIDAVI